MATVGMGMHRYLIVLAAIALAACSGTKSSSKGSQGSKGSQDVKKPVACNLAAQQAAFSTRYPAGLYLTAIGMSKASLAEAEADSKRRIAEQVQSAIRAEVDFRKTAVQGNKKESFSSELLSRVQSTTQFSYAQLIRVETARACKTPGGEHLVAASLRREELGRLLEEESARLTPALTSAQTKALQARHILAFVNPALAAHDEFLRLLVLSTQYRAVTRMDLPNFSEMDARQTELAGHRQSLFLSLRVDPKVVAPPDMARSAQGFQAALAQRLAVRGVAVGPSAPSCANCLVANVRVSATLDPDYRFGPRCELTWEIEAKATSGEERQSLGRGRIASVSGRGDMEDAVAKAWRRMNDSISVAVAADFANALGH